MRDPILFRRNDTLLPTEANYWKDLLYRVSKIGTELEVAPPKGMSRPEFEEGVCKDLAPSGTLELLGANGVLDVQTEHCGIEIRVIGRHPYFSKLQQQYENIISALKARGARPRATCGLHFHLLTPGLAEPVPEIVLANLWNLIRRYAPELKFMTSAGDSRSALCRRRNHNSHLEMVRYSPGTMSMAQIHNKLKESRIVPEHQNFFNLEHLDFTEEGHVLPFHLEFRFPDAELSSTSIAAKTFLFLALVLKSVDLSCYGVMHVGRIDPWRRKLELLDIINNNDGNLATSDTSALTDDMIEELRQGSYELLELLSPTIERFMGDGPLEVLMALAEQPISLLRCAGYDWDKIEELLSSRVTTDGMGTDEVDRRLMQYIELSEWTGLPSAEDWQWRAARELMLTPQDLERRLDRLDMLRGLRWDSRRGTMTFTS